MLLLLLLLLSKEKNSVALVFFCCAGDCLYVSMYYCGLHFALCPSHAMKQFLGLDFHKSPVFQPQIHPRDVAKIKTLSGF